MGQGHLFIVRGDIRRLACDAWLLPCDARGRPHEKWLLPETPLPPAPNLPASWNRGESRALPVGWSPGPGAGPWLVNVEGSDDTPPEWYVEGVRQFLEAVRPSVDDRPRWFPRERPLVALPLVGTGEGGGRDRAGQILALLLDFLARAARLHRWDLALVAHDGPAFAAAQAARQQQTTPDPWADLDAGLKERADELARIASRGGLALFLGAGVSASAGLPLWGELLDKLAERGGMAPDELSALRRLNPLDQAGVIERRLGGTEGLQRSIRELFAAGQYALGHSLLATLPVREVVTTNYDRLFETAWEALGRKPSVLPYRIKAGADRWVLKMHGCVSHPEDIVLTREDHLGYTQRNGALAGIVQTLLITRHMLFVGFSLNDDNFHRIADAVRRVVRAPDCDGEGALPFGTVLSLERSPLVEELWGGDLGWVSMSDGGRETGDPADEREKWAAARRLEVFLDYLVARTRGAAHLLDPRYASVLTAEEAVLRDALVRWEGGLPSAARRALAWAEVARLLAGLGFDAEAAERKPS